MKVSKTEIIKVRGAEHEERPDLLAVEEPLEIRLGYGLQRGREQRSISVTMRTPGDDFELALGFLFTEGIITANNQVAAIKYCEDLGRQEEKGNVVRVELHESVVVDFKRLERHFYTSSSCGVCGKTSIEAVQANCPIVHSDLQMTAQAVHAAPELLRQAQQVFAHTGGLHAAGLFTPAGNLVMMREDVGRHNALDKLIGACLVAGSVPLSDYFVLVSGRGSFELVQKCLMAGVPLMAAVGAPSSLAVELAGRFGMSLLGFVREGAFNIYCGKERIVNNENTH